MTDDECISFLQWALPRMRMSWPGFRKVRGQVRKRITRRMTELAIHDISGYRDYLAKHEDEWPVLDEFCRVSISRFYRDRPVYGFLAREVLPNLARRVIRQGENRLGVWSAGCGSGEEPYTISLIWRLQLQSRFPELSLNLVATDASPTMRRRFTEASYPFSSLRDLPPGWLDTAFIRDNEHYRLKPEFRRDIRFVQEDLREKVPAAMFDLVLCRNLVFTYFDDVLQRDILESMRAVLKPGGALVIGIHESLPEGAGRLEEWSADFRIFRNPV